MHTNDRPQGRSSVRFGRSDAGSESITSSVYSRVTAAIIEALEHGVVPWRSPILASGGAGYPKNLISDKPYRGANVFLLAVTAFAKGYGSSYWLTYQQAKERGGQVKKGEKASLVIFWKPYQVTDKETGETKEVPLLRYYSVFNAEQCEGVQTPEVAQEPPSTFEKVQAAEAIVEDYEGKPGIEHRSSQAYYLPKTDTVSLPIPDRFVSPSAYYATLFHELGHSTGHSSRLDRGLDTNLAPFGSPDYSKEELVAEMTAAFLCAECGLEPAVLENSAAYISGWLGSLRKDHALVIAAGGQAQRAADWIRGTRSVAVVGSGQ
jgi:antirestriction protein ArdC